MSLFIFISAILLGVMAMFSGPEPAWGFLIWQLMLLGIFYLHLFGLHEPKDEK